MPTPYKRPDPLTATQRLYLAAAALLVVGLGAGFLPVLSSNGVQCGAAFYEQRSETESEIQSMRDTFNVPRTEDDCDGVRSTARTIALIALAGGLALAIGGWISAGNRRPEQD